MPYLIDSDYAIDYLGGDFQVRDLIRSLQAEGCAISSIAYMEAFEGVFRSDDVADAADAFETFLIDVPVLSVSESVARRCAMLRIGLRRAGKRVAPRALDLLIAATAIEYGLTVVTRNAKDYADIPELELYPA